MRKPIRVLMFTVSIACATVTASAGVDRFTSISPEGASISSLVIDPLNPSTIYAGASLAGVFKSVDSGESWTLVFDSATIGMDPAAQRFIGPIAIDPMHSSTVYATIINYSGAQGLSGIVKTQDGGATWSLLAGWQARESITELVIDRSSPEILYALTRTDLLQSTDGGVSWSSKAAGLRPFLATGLLCLAIDPSNTSRLYAGTSRGLYVTNDRGGMWQLVHPGSEFHRIAVDPADPAQLYGAYKSSPGNSSTVASLASSSDGGTTWTGRPAAAEWVSQIVVDPASSAAYALIARWQGGEANEILATTDRGKTWNPLPGSQLVPSFLAIGTGSAHLFYAARRGDLFKSADRGESWRSIHRGLTTPYVVDIAVDPANAMTVFAGISRGLVKSGDGGQSWKDANLDLRGPTVSIDSRQPSTVFAFNYEGASRSSDGGETWKAIEPGKRVTGIAVDPSNSSNVYAVLSDSLSRSTDGGSTWSSVGVGQLPLGYYGFEGGAIAVDPATPSNVYAAGSGGIVKSVDAGTTWATVFRPKNPDGEYIRKLLIDPETPSTIYALSYVSVYRSYNEGKDWNIAYSRPSNRTYFMDLDLDPLQVSRLYLATNAGLLKSENGGDSWTDLNEGLPTRVITAVRTDLHGNVYAGTPRGLFVNSPRHDSTTNPSISLRTFFGNYVSATNCGGSSVDANAKTAGPCEMFKIYDLNGGQLNDGDKIHLRASNGKFVAAEDGGRLDGLESPVNANRTLPSAWETFVIRRKGGGTAIVSGDSISLQAINGTYLAAEGGGANNCHCDSRLNANRFDAREWETFTIEVR